MAEAAAHEINNLTQGLFNLLSLAYDPIASPAADASPAPLARYAELAKGGLVDLRQLSRDLRVLGRSADDVAPQRIDHLCANVLAEIEPTKERRLVVDPEPPPLEVVGTGEALHIAIRALARYAVAASPPGATVRLSASRELDFVSVAADAPQAPEPPVNKTTALDTLLLAREPRFGGDVGLVLAGAIARQYGGALLISRGEVGGLHLTLRFRRADKELGNGRSGNTVASRHRRR